MMSEKAGQKNKLPDREKPEMSCGLGLPDRETEIHF
jgi:hypothetical protein